MNLYTIEQRWHDLVSSSTDRRVAGIYETREAAWQAMRDLAIDMGAADVPGTPEQSILINNGEGLAIVPATLHPGDDDTTIPHRVFFLEQWMAGLGHYWYEWPRHDAQHILYRDWKTAVTACKDLAADADAAYADEQLFQHAPGAFSLIQKPNDRDVWRVRVISEAVHLVEEAAL